MRMVYVFLAIMASLMAQPAFAMCSLSVSQILAKSPYFASRMIVDKDSSSESLVVYRHVDDPRVISSFSVVKADPVGMVSRSQHVTQLDEYAKFHVNKAVSQGRWAEKSVFPYDPVAWRVIEETSIDEVGSSLVGHMEIRMTPSCILVSDFISPSSQNLKSRWIQMVQEIASIRDYSSAHVVRNQWLPEDTTPRGLKGLAGGLLSPLAVIVIISTLMIRSRELDVPSSSTKLVLGSCAFLVFGAILYQYNEYTEAMLVEFENSKYWDSFFLLITVGVICLVGTISDQRFAMAGLISSGVGGFSLVVASSLRWTPDFYISLAVGIAMIVMGVLAIIAWNNDTKKSLKKQLKINN